MGHVLDGWTRGRRTSTPKRAIVKDRTNNNCRVRPPNTFLSLLFSFFFGGEGSGVYKEEFNSIYVGGRPVLLFREEKWR